jgi:hypothetical protein
MNWQLRTIAEIKVSDSEMPEDTIMISGRLHGLDLAALHRQFFCEILSGFRRRTCRSFSNYFLLDAE